MEVYTLKTLPSTSKYFAVKAIYGIKCTANDKWYIGQSVNVHSRLRRHRSDLTKNKGSIHLQRAYDKYGVEAFEVYILEVVENNEDLNASERHYMDEYKSYDRSHGFNIGYFKPDLTATLSGTHYERNPNYKRVFGWGDVQVIRELWKEGYNNGDIRKIYKVSTSCIAEIVSNYKWRDPNYKRPEYNEREPLTFEQRKVVNAHILKSDTVEDIYKATGIARGKLYKYFKNKGIPSKRRYSRLLLDTSTGIYYDSAVEAATALCVNKATLKWWLSLRPDLNKTNLVDVDDKVRDPLLIDTTTGIYYTVEEAARLYNVGRGTINSWMARPEINRSNLRIF